ncbi:MAG: hypothetical protein A2Z25_01330 [Planctomycetes bacterium RBG_16_55_9]|nr:MAG: hypothetical protein A2Z25_01330 [Planctomycetes bacterium RBG_16_55_9]
MEATRIGFLFLVFLLAYPGVSHSSENADRNEISQRIHKKRQLFSDRAAFLPPHVSPILRVTNRDLVAQAENLYFEALDYQFLSLKCLRHAQVFLDNGDVDKANGYIQKADRNYVVASALRRDSQIVLDGTYSTAETATKGVKDACETAVKIGLKVTNPSAGKVVDYIYIGVDYVVESAAKGADEARKNAAKRAAVQILFDQIKFRSLGNGTVADYVKNEGGKPLSEILDRLIESQEWKNALSKIIKESGVTLAEEAITNKITKERQTTTNENRKVQIPRFSIQQHLTDRLGRDEKEKATITQTVPTPTDKEIPVRKSSVQNSIAKYSPSPVQQSTVEKSVEKLPIQEPKSQVQPDVEKPVPATRALQKPQEAVKIHGASMSIDTQKPPEPKKSKEIEQSKIVQNPNPSLSEINTEIERLAKKHQIPPIIIKAICYHETRKYGGWCHYDPDTGEVIVGKDPSGSFGYGIMQFTPFPIITPETMKKNPMPYYHDWKINLQTGVEKLLQKWSENGEQDVNKPYLENWYYPIAWYNGNGKPAYNYVTSIYEYMRNPTLMSPQVAKFCRAVDISSPRSIPGWDVKTIESAKGKVKAYYLNEIVEAGEQVHLWNGKTGEHLEYQDVTNQYRSKTVKEPTQSVATQQPAVPTFTSEQPNVVVTQKPNPPRTTSPGLPSEPGPVIDSAAPLIFQWTSASSTDYYALAISEYPYGSSNIVYSPQQISGISHTIPSGKLQPGKKYRWNMQAHNSAGWSSVSRTLYFHTAAPKSAPTPEVTLTLYIHEGSVNGPIIAGARVNGRDSKGKSFDKATSSAGYVTIAGAPGSWPFTVSKDGYQTNSWSQDITSSVRRDAYLTKVPEKPKSSARFNMGDTVTAMNNLNVHTGPGTGSPEIKDSDYRGYAPSGTKGKIVDGPTSADGYSWWKVDFGPGLYSGWSVEGGIKK